MATLISVYADWGFARIKGIGWGWAGVIWVYSVVTFFPLDWFKFLIRYILSGKAWNSLLDERVRLVFSLLFVKPGEVGFADFTFSLFLGLQIAFTTKKDFGIEEREAQWALAQRTLHGLQNPQTAPLFADKSSYRELSEIAEQAKRRAEIARSSLFLLLSQDSR